MQVREGDNQYFRFQDLVSNAIWKAASLASAAVLSERMPRLGKLLNTLQGTQHFNEKLIAQTLQLPLVIFDCRVKLVLSHVEKSDFHYLRYFARTSDSETDFKSPA